jgi:CubicO group peptidase (beta-lactamase class C family)
VAALVSPNACGPSRNPSRTVRIDKLFGEWNRADAPGCAVGVSHNGAIVYEHGYGMANLERGVPITPETVFPIASISKAFTAMSVLLAAEHGQLSLDDEVQKFIPEWVDREDHVTIRHLLTHTSGLRDAFTLLGWAPPSESAGDQNEGIVRMLARQRGLNFAPGTKYEYNNGGYNLLASILKRATGQSLRAFADGSIFKPLGMTRSHFHDDPTMLVPNRASGYTRTLDSWRLAKEEGGIVGNAGMYSTVGDLLRWTQNFTDVRVGSPALIAAMQTPAVLNDGTATGGGMGFALGEYRGVRIVETAGGGPGIATEVMRYPDQRLVVAVLCNEDSVATGGMARVNPDMFTNGIADIYIADALAPVAASPASATTPPPRPATKPVTLSAEEVSDMTGLYRFVLQDWPILISAGRGVLLWRSYYLEDFDYELTPVGANRFLFNGNVPFEFVPSTAGKPKQWRIVDSPGDLGLVLPVTFVPPASELSSYTGDYHSDQIGVTFTVERRGSVLALKNGGWVDTSVQGFSKDVFAGDVVGIVKFSRDARGTVTGFSLNRGGARDVRFDRVRRR